MWSLREAENLSLYFPAYRALPTISLTARLETQIIARPVPQPSLALWYL
jgi:hypothetical protein